MIRRKDTQQEMDACNRLRHAYADFERTRDYSKFILSFTDEIEGFTDYFSKDETVLCLMSQTGLWREWNSSHMSMKRA